MTEEEGGGVRTVRVWACGGGSQGIDKTRSTPHEILRERERERERGRKLASK